MRTLKQLNNHLEYCEGRYQDLMGCLERLDYLSFSDEKKIVKYNRELNKLVKEIDKTRELISKN